MCRVVAYRAQATCGCLSYVRGSLLIPLMLMLISLGSFLSYRIWEDLVLLTVLGVSGYFLKKYK